MDWFKNWFDSFYYHKLYRHRNTAEAKEFIDALIQFIQPKKNARILDLACGKGRHSIYLNKKGFDVVGVDLSQNSIDEANKHANSTLHFSQMDMRNLHCTEPFDFVMNLFTSFGYFAHKSENIQVLEGVHKILNPKGIVVIDFLNASQVIRNLIPEEVKTVDNITFTINRFVENNTVVKAIKIQDQKEILHFEERVSMFELEDFEEMFAQTKFKLLHHFGSYHLDAFDADHSERLILIAQKED